MMEQKRTRKKVNTITVSHLKPKRNRFIFLGKQAGDAGWKYRLTLKTERYSVELQ
mgnify:CR=1 FL=1